MLATWRSRLLSKWPIRDKLLVGLSLLLVIVGTLSWGGLQGLYAYRALVRNLHGRVETELPLLNEFSKSVGDLRGARAPRTSRPGRGSISARVVGEDFKSQLMTLTDDLRSYRQQFGDEGPQARLAAKSNALSPHRDGAEQVGELGHRSPGPRSAERGSCANCSDFPACYCSTFRRLLAGDRRSPR